MSLKCPKCGSSDILPIVYGCPTEENIKRMHDGEITLGGCKGRKENKYCKKCHEYFVFTDMIKIDR